MVKATVRGMPGTAVSFSMLAAQEKPWFDMQNCAFCKNLTAEEGLMDHITKWDHHNVDNGSVCITVVDKEYLEAYKRAMHNMEEVGKKLEQGEMLPMCGLCKAYGELLKMGAKRDMVESDNVFVSIMRGTLRPVKQGPGSYWWRKRRPDHSLVAGLRYLRLGRRLPAHQV